MRAVTEIGPQPFKVTMSWPFQIREGAEVAGSGPLHFLKFWGRHDAVHRVSRVLAYMYANPLNSTYASRLPGSQHSFSSISIIF